MIEEKVCDWGELETPIEDKEKILIIDGNNLAHRDLFSSIHFHPEDNENFYLWRHQFFSDIVDKIKMFEPTKVIIAMDSKNSWRYTIYNRYKEDRKAHKEASVVDFEKFYPVFNDFIKDIKETFTTIHVLAVDRTEGDDIVSIVGKHLSKDTNEIIILSSDKDFNQLLISKNIKQYDPIKQKFIENINPKLNLQLKILTGDKSDSIPSVKKRFGVKSAEKVLNEGLGEFLDLPENKDIKANYERNQILIDFNYIPKDIVDKIINNYTTYEIKDVEMNKVLNFFRKNGLVQLLDRWPSYSKYIKKLK